VVNCETADKRSLFGQTILLITYQPAKFPFIDFKMSTAKWENNEEIKIFREYLRIPTVHPNVDYSEFYDGFVYLYEYAIRR